MYEIDEHLKERQAYAEALADSVVLLENELKNIRKIIGYSVINEALTDEPAKTIQEWKDRSKQPCDLYFILNEEKSLVKIGISHNAMSRIKNMQTATGYYLELLHVIHFKHRYEAEEAERWLHSHYGLYRRRPIIKKSSEWFDAEIIGDLMLNFNTAEKIQKEIEGSYENQKVIAEEFGRRLNA